MSGIMSAVEVGIGVAIGVDFGYSFGNRIKFLHLTPSRNQCRSASPGQKADSAQSRKTSGSAPKTLRQKNSSFRMP